MGRGNNPDQRQLDAAHWKKIQSIIKSRNSNPSSLSESKITSYIISDPQVSGNQFAQVSHRIQLVRLWGIPPGARVLEIGCGHGNCTAVLAEAVGSGGHIDAIDPAPGNNGTHFTQTQAQTHITISEIGNRITWHQADAIDFLDSNEDKWEFVVLSHCIWNFKSSSTLKEILDKLKGRTPRICIAEHTLKITSWYSRVHVMAVQARAALEAYRNGSENIQSILVPTGIKDMASETLHWKLEYETIVRPGWPLDDGRREAGIVADAKFAEAVEKNVSDEHVRLSLQSMRDSVLSEIEDGGGLEEVSTMDTWVAVFVAPETDQQTP